MVEDFYLGQCAKCNKKAIIAIDAGELPLCAYHFVEQEDDECLKAFFQSLINEKGKAEVNREIQKETKKQKPELYNQLKSLFS